MIGLIFIALAVGFWIGFWVGYTEKKPVVMIKRMMPDGMTAWYKVLKSKIIHKIYPN